MLGAKVAIAAEDAGFDSLWTGEHVVLPDPQAPPSPAPPQTPMLDPAAALAFLAERFVGPDPCGYAEQWFDQELAVAFGVDVFAEPFDDARGYCAVALGLMDDRGSIEQIQGVIAKSKYKPELLKQAAVGLGLLGDKQLVPELIEMLKLGLKLVIRRNKSRRSPTANSWTQSCRRRTNTGRRAGVP